MKIKSRTNHEFHLGTYYKPSIVEKRSNYVLC